MLRNESGSKISFCWFPPLFGGDSKHMWLNHRGRRLKCLFLCFFKKQMVGCWCDLLMIECWDSCVHLEYPVVRGLEREVVPSLINFRKPCFLHHLQFVLGFCETTLEMLIEIVLTINTLFLLFHFIFLLSSLSSFSPLYFLGFFSDNKLRVIFRISKISIEAPYQLAYQRNNHQPGKSRNLENNWNTVKSSSTMVPQIIHLSHFKFIEPWKVKDRSK